MEDPTAQAVAFGSRIERLRRARGLNQAELAERVGVHKQTVSDWEVGRVEGRGISLANAARIAVALGCSLDDLAGLTPPPAGFPAARDGDLHFIDTAKLEVVRKARSLRDVDAVANQPPPRGHLTVTCAFRLTPSDVIVTKDQYEATLAEVARILASLPSRPPK